MEIIPTCSVSAYCKYINSTLDSCFLFLISCPSQLKITSEDPIRSYSFTALQFTKNWGSNVTESGFAHSVTWGEPAGLSGWDRCAFGLKVSETILKSILIPSESRCREATGSRRGQGSWLCWNPKGQMRNWASVQPLFSTSSLPVCVCVCYFLVSAFLKHRIIYSGNLRRSVWWSGVKAVWGDWQKLQSVWVDLGDSTDQMAPPTCNCNRPTNWTEILD